MIHTIYPYGSIAFSEVASISKGKDRFILTDRTGNIWQIEEATFNDLEKKGVKVL